MRNTTTTKSSMDPLTRAWLKVVIDGQAYLYAQQQKADGFAFSNEEVEKFMNEWKVESEKLVQELLDDEVETGSGDSPHSNVSPVSS